ncbi:chlorophyll a/b-binding protein [Anthocerotibacter panamensis]|uniref:chlorophyll a/b-binding protein n=1 Tax=Anthocerotibacter panamensis TaxID=2857077 RepID=UPI001C40396A|nr:chlorophyll a/b-binding protein [Anthocerotibacter panamensis]
MTTNKTTDEAKFGFVPYAEMLNGRLAMIGFLAALLVEVATGKGVLHFLGLV